jgi:hypothetical protein
MLDVGIGLANGDLVDSKEKSEPQKNDRRGLGEGDGQHGMPRMKSILVARYASPKPTRRTPTL